LSYRVVASAETASRTSQDLKLAPQSCRSRWDVWKWMELLGFCVRLDEDEGMDAREQKRLLQTGMVFVPSILASSRAWLLVHQLVHWGRQTMQCRQTLHSELFTCQIASRWTKGARRSCLQTPRLRTWTRSLKLHRGDHWQCHVSSSCIASVPHHPVQRRCKMHHTSLVHDHHACTKQVLVCFVS